MNQISLNGLPTIDRASPVPFYFQLKSAIEREIADGRWPPGERIPPEMQMCEHFEVSRTTVRQALTELTREGLLVRERGSGTFVAEPARRDGGWELQLAQGFWDEARRGDHVVVSKVLERVVEPLDGDAARDLGVAPGTPGVRLERLRWVDGALTMHVVSHLRAELADAVLAADLEQGSLYAALAERAGVAVGGGWRDVEAVAADARRAELLEVPAGTPLLRVDSVSLDGDGRPFERYRAWHRGDRTRLHIHVLPEGEIAERRAGA
ncbi:GntR family transcriptional regulator [Patulibacter sp. S7RM1-6]